MKKNSSWHKIGYNEWGEVKEMKFGNYTILVNPDNSVTPYVAAWMYDEEDGTWAQGHYFKDLHDAMEYAYFASKEA